MIDETFLCPEASFANGFQYPQSFLDVIAEDDLIDLDPWWFLCEFDGLSQQWLNEIKKQYPERNLIPFAKKSDSGELGQEAAAKGYKDAIKNGLQAYDATAGGVTFRVYIDQKSGAASNFHPKQETL